MPELRHHFLSVEEAAEMLQVHPETIYRKIRAGKLRATKAAGVWRIDPDDFDAWIAGSRPEPVLAQPDRMALPWANGGGVR